jgi:hypothetical protein
VIWHDNNSGAAAEWVMANGSVSQVVLPGGAPTNWQIVRSG